MTFAVSTTDSLVRATVSMIPGPGGDVSNSPKIRVDSPFEAAWGIARSGPHVPLRPLCRWIAVVEGAGPASTRSTTANRFEMACVGQTVEEEVKVDHPTMGPPLSGQCCECSKHSSCLARSQKSASSTSRPSIGFKLR